MEQEETFIEFSEKFNRIYADRKDTLFQIVLAYESSGVLHKSYSILMDTMSKFTELNTVLNALKVRNQLYVFLEVMVDIGWDSVVDFIKRSKFVNLFSKIETERKKESPVSIHIKEPVMCSTNDKEIEKYKVGGIYISFSTNSIYAVSLASEIHQKYSWVCSRWIIPGMKFAIKESYVKDHYRYPQERMRDRSDSRENISSVNHCIIIYDAKYHQNRINEEELKYEFDLIKGKGKNVIVLFENNEIHQKFPLKGWKKQPTRLFRENMLETLHSIIKKDESIKSEKNRRKKSISDKPSEIKNSDPVIGNTVLPTQQTLVTVVPESPTYSSLYPGITTSYNNSPGALYFTVDPNNMNGNISGTLTLTTPLNECGMYQWNPNYWGSGVLPNYPIQPSGHISYASYPYTSNISVTNSNFTNSKVDNSDNDDLEPFEDSVHKVIEFIDSQDIKCARDVDKLKEILPLQYNMSEASAKIVNSYLKLMAEKYSQETSNSNNSDSNEQILCVICFEQRKNVMLIPCKHLCICIGCKNNTKELCPLCRTPIAQYIDGVFI